MWFINELNTNHIFSNPLVQKTFPRYLKILQNQTFARFLIAKQFEIDPCILKIDEEENLWKKYTQIASEFREKVRSFDIGVKVKEFNSPNYLDLKIKIASLLENPCRLCEKKCARNRSEGEVGYCLVSEIGSVASAFLHYGEEPVLVPSGTIFFNGCTFRCVFCQNWDIAQNKYLTNDNLVQNLTITEKSLAKKGARNLNYVGGDPTPNLKQILQSWINLNVNITQLFNSNQFLSLYGMKLIENIFDFWLPDFKY